MSKIRKMSNYVVPDGYKKEVFEDLTGFHKRCKELTFDVYGYWLNELQMSKNYAELSKAVRNLLEALNNIEDCIKKI